MNVYLPCPARAGPGCQMTIAGGLHRRTAPFSESFESAQAGGAGCCALSPCPGRGELRRAPGQGRASPPLGAGERAVGYAHRRWQATALPLQGQFVEGTFAGGRD